MDLFTKSEWNILGQAAKQEGWLEKYKIDKRYPDLTPAQKAEEAAAEAYGDWFVNPKAIKNQGAKNLFERIKRFLAAINKSIRKSLGKADNEPVTFEDIFGRIESGEVAARAGEGLGASIGAPEVTVPDVELPQVSGMTALQGAHTGDRNAKITGGYSGERPQSVSDIQASLRKALGLTVKQGNLDPTLKAAARASGGDLKGQFNRDTGVIRMAFLNDFPTEVHEIGHDLETRWA
ncbi:MAG: hypothetical protein ACPG6L_11920, partial [Nereida ignava]